MATPPTPPTTPPTMAPVLLEEPEEGEGVGVPELTWVMEVCETSEIWEDDDDWDDVWAAEELLEEAAAEGPVVLAPV